MRHVIEESKKWILKHLSDCGTNEEADALFCEAWGNGNLESEQARACLTMIEFYCPSADEWDEEEEDFVCELGKLAREDEKEPEYKCKLLQSQTVTYKTCPKVFEWKTKYLNAPIDSGRPERSKCMLTRVAIVENVVDDKGKTLTPVVLVEAEDVPVIGTTSGLRERMLVKYAAKLKGKDLRKIEVVCSDFRPV